ncbi:MAG: glycyl-radical enzyme activating protein [Desulfobacterales bacterium]|nr:glycyl-radical enzyme activating protein [Desulfobacterales bacterium]
MEKAIIAEIKENSLDDGPGIRTVLFFKGCPLSCVWCHNPETKSARMELSFDAKECIGLKDCLRVCSEKALDPNFSGFIHRDLCSLCFNCVNACANEAFSVVGKTITIDEILEIICRYIPFYKTSGGGITLSGGEFTVYMEFCGKLLKKVKDLGIHTLVETCGFFDIDNFEKFIIPNVDQIYFDIKIMDEVIHKKYCGRSNKQILDNFSKLYMKHLNGELQVIPRVPLVPEITATPNNLLAIANFFKANYVKQVSLLPYNPLWIEKADKIGKTANYNCKQWMTAEEIERYRSYFQDFEIVKV